MRTGRPRSALVSWRAPWGQRFPEEPGSATFQVVLRGSCWLLPPEGEPVALSMGDVVFLPQGGGYGLADDPSALLAEPVCDPFRDGGATSTATLGGTGAETVTLCCGYRLAPARSHPSLRSLPSVIHLPARLGRHPELRAAVDLLAQEIETPRLGTDTVVSSLIDVLHLYILRAWFEAEGAQCSDSGWAAALTDPAVSAALDALHRDPAHPWTVQSLGQRAGLSRAAFSRRFTDLIGKPPLAYLTWWRLSIAARLLQETDASVAEVAKLVGYGSEFAFGNAFKREHGISPGRYRRRTDCAPVS
ncbi:AraC family transcriptional regulator [Microbispora amethystogenes]|nr:AraC family transcriptional regulator [Microbispora amethystogenes]